ncbi:endonuclease/exonuclease/phosphatase family protein [Parvicella tangerina]|uniref:Endonuclease/exonuclease/phosphatase domain-containing protein n=1 Tax=Parvicella tangerina TaxID=2829795 RepID=A0A916JNX2_9FLAO|nr:hypothetical protein [Parvicella tangerina]CAG5081728.1 hypothetical protein CRYO30217_01713 [Parvicella tangerina]
MRFLLPLVVISLTACNSANEETSGIQHGEQTNNADQLQNPENTSGTAYSIGFYNVENLFDTEDDPYTEDEWFLPTSETQWDEEKYQTKLINLAKVIDAMNEAPGGPDLIGLCEVENKAVVLDLSLQKALTANNYEVVHFDSPDVRGIDVAAMYNPEKLHLISARNINVPMPEDPAITTRDILFCEFEVIESGKLFSFYVNHWSSRRGGAEETFFKRENCAEALLNDLNSSFLDWKSENIIIVGDMNDYPTDKSLTDVLGAGEPKSASPLWNLQYENHKKGLGTYNYKGEWGCLDNVIVSESVYFHATPVKILKEDWMMYVNDEGEAYPNRTYGGSNYYGGYSDHLPVYFEVNL